MNETINIPAILKGKPQGTKLHDLVRGIDVYFAKVDDCNKVHCTFEENELQMFHYSSKGTLVGFEDGMVILLPSEEMRDWRKFAWKKGDVLISNDGKKEVFFNGFADDTYALFKAKHGFEVLPNGNTIYIANEEGIATDDYVLEDNDAAQTYINTIEERLGGKLNRKTLEIEPAQPEFKDGDILSNPSTALSKNHIFIFSKFDKHKDFEHHVALTASGVITIPTSHGIWCRKDSGVKYATEEEKKQLFSALEKEGKAWDAEKKMIVDLEPKVEFKTLDYVLCKSMACYEGDAWNLFQYAYQNKEGIHIMVGGAAFKTCIPYIGNEHLLGTKDSSTLPKG